MSGFSFFGKIRIYLSIRYEKNSKKFCVLLLLYNFVSWKFSLPREQWSLQFFRDPLMIQTRAMMVENNPGSVTYFNNRDRSRKHCLTRVRVHRDEPGREHGWINHGVTIHAEGVSWISCRAISRSLHACRGTATIFSLFPHRCLLYAVLNLKLIEFYCKVFYFTNAWKEVKKIN